MRLPDERTSSATAAAALLLLAALALPQPAASAPGPAAPDAPELTASDHCGSLLLPQAGSQTPTRVTTSTSHATNVYLRTRYFDSPQHCGIDLQRSAYYVNGGRILDSGYQLDGDHYWFDRCCISFSPGTHTINASVFEKCCDPWGSQTKAEFPPYTLTVVQCASGLMEDHGHRPAPWEDTTALQPTIRVLFRYSEPSCGVKASDVVMHLDGERVAPSVTKSGGNYVVSYTPPRVLAGGWHDVDVSIQEDCCTHGGGPQGGSASWGFQIVHCGENPHTVLWHRPIGPQHDAQPLIEAAFRDPDRACGVESFSMTLDGAPVDATGTRVGDDYVVSYTPPTPLIPGTHTVTVEVTEACCNNLGERNRGRTTWSFAVLGEAGDPVERRTTIPRLNASVGPPTSVDFPGYCAPQACVDPFSVPLPDALTVGVETEEAPASVLLDPTRTEHKEDEHLDLVVTSVTYCRGEGGGCDVPDPKAEARLRTNVTVTVTVLGQVLVRETVPVEILP